MRRFQLVVLAFAIPLLAVAQSETLTNGDVLAMLKAGLSAEIVEAKIRATASKFDTSAKSLADLKAAQVPDRVILAMVQAGSGTATQPPVSGSATDTKAPPQEPPEEITVYVTRTGQRYHREGCVHLSKSKVPMSLSQASQYYTPCSLCRPQPPVGTAQVTPSPPETGVYRPRHVSTAGTYQPRTVQVRGYYRKDGTYVRPHTRRRR